MSRNETTFVGHRLTEAREIRGITKKELADLLGKSPQAVSGYEIGTFSPNTDTMDDICRILNLPLSFFTHKGANSCINGPIYFRSLKSTLNTKRKQAGRWLQWVSNRIEFYNQYLDFPQVNLPKYEIDWNDLSDDRLEDIAGDVRKFWGLGNGPINNLTLLFENNGIIISHYNLGIRELDACSTIINGLPIILINTHSASCSRILMDLAHELGHIVLHTDVDRDQLTNKEHTKLEKQAWCFAAAFLMPTESFATEVVDTRLAAFTLLKRRWRVSIAAMIMRCKTLMIIDDYRKSYLFREMARKKQRTVEPLDNVLEIEIPHLLLDADKLILENEIMTKGELLDSSFISDVDYCKIIGADENYFEHEVVKPKLRPKLRIVK